MQLNMLYEVNVNYTCIQLQGTALQLRYNSDILHLSNRCLKKIHELSLLYRVP